MSSRSLLIPSRIKVEARLGHFLLETVWFILTHRTIRFKSTAEKIKETSLTTCPFFI